jgi:hypothetical protein
MMITGSWANVVSIAGIDAHGNDMLAVSSA